MPKKLKEEELNKISGGNSDKTNFTCRSPKCKKTFTSEQAVYHGFEVYCPYCGAFCDYLGD